MDFLMKLDGKTDAYAYPKNETPMDQLGASERSVQRWKQKLADVGIIRIISCFRSNGTQTARVEFVPNGFVLLASYPIPREGMSSLAVSVRTHVQEGSDRVWIGNVRSKEV